MSSPDAATRSRYVHALIATSRRRRQGEGNVALFRTMMADSNHLHLIGRYVMITAMSSTRFSEANSQYG
jgi:hypothetical protein